jgi:hypothetical protein
MRAFFPALASYWAAEAQAPGQRRSQAGATGQAGHLTGQVAAEKYGQIAALERLCELWDRDCGHDNLPPQDAVFPYCLVGSRYGSPAYHARKTCGR